MIFLGIDYRSCAGRHYSWISLTVLQHPSGALPLPSPLESQKVDFLYIDRSEAA